MFIQLNKNEEEIRDEILAKIPDTYQKTPGFFTWDFVCAIAFALKTIWEKIEYICGFGDINNFEYDNLVKFVYQRRGIIAKTATFSQGLVSVVKGEGHIKEGDLFETPGGLRFKSMQSLDATEGDTFTVKCLTQGSAGNIGADAITVIPATIQGIIEVTNPKAFTNGYDKESKESIIERYLDDLQKPVVSNNIYQYLKWAKECTGVGDAKIKPLWNGDNTVKVVIINSNNEAPSQELVKSVQDYIDPYTIDSLGNKTGWGCGNGKAPIGAYCTIEGAVEKKIDITVSVVLRNSSTIDEAKEGIEKNLKDYFKSVIFSNSYISYSQIGAAILSSPAVKDYDNNSLLLNDDNNNIILIDGNDKTEIPVLGTLTVNVSEKISR